jgi:hypothetical protein
MLVYKKNCGVNKLFHKYMYGPSFKMNTQQKKDDSCKFITKTRLLAKIECLVIGDLNLTNWDFVIY